MSMNKEFIRNSKHNFSLIKTSKYFVIPLLAMIISACNSGSTTPSDSTANSQQSVTVTLNDGTTVTIPSTIYSPMNQQYTTLPLIIKGGPSAKGDQLSLSVVKITATQKIISGSSIQLIPTVTLDKPIVNVQSDETTIVGMSVNSEDTAAGSYTTTLNINYDDESATLQDIIIDTLPACSSGPSPLSLVPHLPQTTLITSTAGTPIKVGATSTYTTSLLYKENGQLCYLSCTISTTNDGCYNPSFSMSPKTTTVANIQDINNTGLLTAESAGTIGVRAETQFKVVESGSPVVHGTAWSMTYVTVESSE